MEIKRFRVSKLYGVLNYDLRFQDNTLILIGENGSSKTTIIRMLFYTLSLQWRKLSKYDFDTLTIAIGEDELIIKKKDINSIPFIDDYILRRIPLQIRQEILSTKGRFDTFDIEKIEMICRKFDYPIEYILKESDLREDLFSKAEHSKMNDIRNKLEKYIGSSHIMYLPTYRRIEQELRVVLDGRMVDDNEYRNKRTTMQMQSRASNNNFTELIEFGMDDVVEARDKNLNHLKDFFRNSLNQMTLQYLGDVVDKEYENFEIGSLKDVDEETITKIMQRVDERILTKEGKDKLRQSIEKIKSQGEADEVHDKVVCHYFNKLLNSHRELESKEVNIRKFAEVCSKYIENKEINYDSTNFTFSIISGSGNNKQQIELNQLSSGEKQIVSLFSHLYLDGQRKYLVLIDEPELSLSVRWQKQFLADIYKSDFCDGIIAVTHSPFIFDNELDSYAHGVEEFIKK